MPTQRPSGRSRAVSGPGRRPGPRRPRSAGAAARPARPRFTGRAAVLVLVLAVLAISYASSMRAYLEQKAHIESLRESIAQSRQNLAELERERRRWKDDAYVEAEAKRRLGWVMPGEISFQVIGKDGRPLGHEDTLSDPDAIEVENEPAWWETAWDTMEAAGHPEDVPHPADQIRAPRKNKQ